MEEHEQLALIREILGLSPDQDLLEAVSLLQDTQVRVERARAQERKSIVEYLLTQSLDCQRVAQNIEAGVHRMTMERS